MASISASRLQSLSHTSPNPTREPSHFPRFVAASPRYPLSSLKRSELGLCRCRNANLGSPPSGDDGGWMNLESLLHDAVRSAVKRLEDCVNSFRKLSDKGELQQGNEGGIKKDAEAPTAEEEESKDWNWERWRRHFSEIEEHEWIASVLKVLFYGYIFFATSFNWIIEIYAVCNLKKRVRAQLDLNADFSMARASAPLLLFCHLSSPCTSCSLMCLLSLLFYRDTTYLMQPKQFNN